MGMPARTQRRWTAREVRSLIVTQPLAAPRYELVDGALLVTPSPAMAHQLAVSRLLVTLVRYLEVEGIGVAMTSPSDVELQPEDIRQPDVFVVTTEEMRRVLRDGNPVRQLLLAIEVLSPSSAQHDRLKKRRGYQRHVPEYWIVDTDSRLIERWRATDTRPEILSDVLEWQPPGARAKLTIEVPSFFVRVFGEDL